jgi:hypothetical protein
MQRKCTCGGECASCSGKRNRAGQIGHRFGDIHVHAETDHRIKEPGLAEHGFAGRVSPVRLAEIENGETGCDVTKGVPDIVIGQPSLCNKHCTERHEEVHKKDIGPCCARANAAWKNAKDDKKDAVQDKMNEWVKRNEYWLQCRAYAESVKCADEFLKENCGGKRPQNVESAPSPVGPDTGKGDFPITDVPQAGGPDSPEPKALAEDKPATEEPKPIDPERCCATVKEYRFHANARHDAYCKDAKGLTPCPF